MKKFLGFIFNKNFWVNKWTIAITSIIIIIFGVAFIYLYNPVFIPQPIRIANKKVVDKIVGKELAERIDKTRDENGATSIRTLFNTNKEENLERHCKKKEEKGKEQGKCYKTYKNEEFGFSVKYPEEYSMEANNESFGKGVSFYPPDNKNYTDNRTGSVDIGIWSKEGNLGVDSVMGFIHYKDSVIGEDEIITNEGGGFQDEIELVGMNWKRNYSHYKTSKGNIFKQLVIAGEKENKIYAISLYSIEEENKSLLHEEEYNELIKTFSFN